MLLCCIEQTYRVHHCQGRFVIPRCSANKWIAWVALKCHEMELAPAIPALLLKEVGWQGHNANVIFPPAISMINYSPCTLPSFIHYTVFFNTCQMSH